MFISFVHKITKLKTNTVKKNVKVCKRRSFTSV